MDIAPSLAVVGLVGFMIGSIPTGVILSRTRYGLDVREVGSGNIGATNITRTFGWFAGALTFFIDAIKGFFPLTLVVYLDKPQEWVLVGGAALVLGHCYSVFLRFRGGKGVATSFGCLLAVIPWGALIAGLVYGLVLAITRISALGSLSGVVVLLVYPQFVSLPEQVAWLVYLISLIVIIRHRSNIHRLITEWMSSKEKRSKSE